MSSVFKGVAKVFKKVAKVVKKIAPIVLLAAAVVFTAGAAITAVTGAVGPGVFSWAGRLTTFLGSKFGTGTLGNIVTGAVTKGLMGTATGALTAAVTGGDIKKGALIGALGGAALGGIQGALTPTAAAAAPAAAPGAAAPGSPSVPAGARAAIAGANQTPAGGTPVSPAQTVQRIPGGGGAAAAPAAAPASPNVAGTSGVAGTTGVAGRTGLLPPPETPWKDLTALQKLGRVAGKASNNQTVVAVAGGAAKALLEGEDGRESAARIDADSAAADRNQKIANYDTGSAGLLTPEMAAGLEPPSGMGRKYWQWNPSTRRIELTPA